MKRYPCRSTNRPPSPRIASVIRLRLLPAIYSTVGWNCTNSMSRSSAPRAQCQSVAVPRRNRRIGRLAIDLPGSARAQNRLLSPDHRLVAALVGNDRTAASAFMRQQVEGKGVGADFNVGKMLDTVDDCPHHFLARRVAKRVDDPIVAVPSLATKYQLPVRLVETSSPFDQFSNSTRSLTDHHFDHLLVAERAARDQGVGNVLFEAILGVNYSGDAPLCKTAVRLLDRVLRDDERRQTRWYRNRRPQTGQPSSNDQHIGKAMRQGASVQTGPDNVV